MCSSSGRSWFFVHPFIRVFQLTDLSLQEVEKEAPVAKLQLHSPTRSFDSQIMTRNKPIGVFIEEDWLRNSALACHELEADTHLPETTYTSGGRLIATVLEHSRSQQQVQDAYAVSLDQDAVPPATSRLSIPLSYPANTLPEQCHSGYRPHYDLTIGVSNILLEDDGDSVHITRPDEKLRYMRETIGEAMVHSQRCSSTRGGYFHETLRDKEDGLINSLIAFGKGKFTRANDCSFGYEDNPVTGSDLLWRDPDIRI